MGGGNRVNQRHHVIDGAHNRRPQLLFIAGYRAHLCIRCVHRPLDSLPDQRLGIAPLLDSAEN